MKKGDAPCGRCGQQVVVNLSGYYESDGADGWNWECISGQNCVCGEPLQWLHQPAPAEPLKWSIAATRNVEFVN